MFTSPGSIALSVGPLDIHWYGIVIALGIFFAFQYAIFALKNEKDGRKHMENLFFWLVVSGITGARLYYVLFNLSYFLSKPLEILQIWQGGLAIHGALIGGAIALLIYVRKNRINILRYLDALLPGVLLAQGIGRWGNFFNSEAFGTQTNLPWKLFIPLDNRPPLLESFEYFHPTFLYESIWNIVGFILLALLARRLNKSNFHGAISCLYLIWYSFGRFFIEGLRTDSLMLGNFRIAQLVSLTLVFIGVFGLRFVYSRGKITRR